MLESRVFESLFDIIPFAVYVVDVETYEVVFMNQHFVERFGDHRGAVCWSALYEMDGPCAGCMVGQLLGGDGRPSGQTHIFEQFNELDEHWYQMQEKAISWPDGRVVKYSIAVDISELKAAQNSLAEAHAQLALKSRELERLSITDPLTGLANRLRLDQALAQENSRAERSGHPYAVILIDLDHFKSVNDTYGHQVGDQVLVSTARILKAQGRELDVIGRWGGEEFLILCPNTALAGALELAERLRAQIAEEDFAPVGRRGASLGVASWRPGDRPSSLVGRADAALYRAKEAGRNRVEPELA
jgi:diguanylate cyclase (GGDEF)-like protein